MVNAVGRPDKGARKTINFRIPDATLMEIYLYNPHMMAPGGGTRYGAMQEYLLGLVNRDLEQQRARALEAANANQAHT